MARVSRDRGGEGSPHQPDPAGDEVAALVVERPGAPVRPRVLENGVRACVLRHAQHRFRLRGRDQPEHVRADRGVVTLDFEQMPADAGQFLRHHPDHGQRQARGRHFQGFGRAGPAIIQTRLPG